MSRLISIVFLLLISYQRVESSKEVNRRLREEEIIPDILGKLSDDVNLLKVSWDDKIKAELGNVLTPTQVQNQPKVEYNAEDDAYYTLVMQDPDAPSRKEPSRREFRHWLVINIPGKEIECGETIWEYIGSGPPEGSGLHRYVFMVFKQPAGKISFDGPYVSNHSSLGRSSTSTRDLVNKYQLELVAANFYQAEYDDYVPILHTQLSGKSGK